MLCAEVLARLGPERVRRDLLVGFDPVAAFLQRLEQRFGEAATFCADALGGAGVGVKWSAKVHARCLHACVLHAGRICTQEVTTTQS